MSILMNLPELSTENMLNNSSMYGLTSNFREELIKIYEDIKANATNKNIYSDFTPLIEKSIKKHTGMSVKIKSAHKVFAMYPPDVNKNHVLTPNDQRESLDPSDMRKQYFLNKEVTKRQGQLKGSIDLNKFKVSGDFADVQFDMFIDPTMIFKDLEADECAEITLHEIGHCFSYLSMCANTVSAVLPLLATLNNIANSEDDAKRTIILKEYNEYDETLTKVDVKELAGKSKEVIYTALVLNYVKDTRSTSGSKLYDVISAEQLADKFVTRNGGGLGLTRGLDKLYVKYHRKKYRTSMTGVILRDLWAMVMSFLYFTMAGVSIFLLPTLSLLGIPFALLGILCTLFFAIGELYLRSDDIYFGVYDNDVNRFNRIREDMINMLKDKNINAELATRIRKDIREIDVILSNYHRYRSPIGKLGDILSGTRARVRQVDFYRELEQLVANNLYLASHDLRKL